MPVRGTQLGRRRLAAATAVALFAALPFAVFHRTILDAASQFRLEFVYLMSGWTAWVLILLGVLCFIPVALSIGRDEYSRWFLKPAIRRAYEAWGVSLYVLGMLLAVQTAQVAKLV
jgi:hypothetical protein